VIQTATPIPESGSGSSLLTSWSFDFAPQLAGETPALPGGAAALIAPRVVKFAIPVISCCLLWKCDYFFCMMNYRSLAAALLLCGMVMRAAAGLLSPLSVDELRDRADLILHATVKAKACERNAEGRIFTRVQAAVTEVLKGTLQTNVVDILYSGGIIGNEGETSSVQANYEVGEEVVAFLKINDLGQAVTVGVVQGKFKVWEDKATGQRFVHNTFHGVSPSEAANSLNKSRQMTLTDLTQRAKGERK
jgi:hypothetical protein